jgi:hypothetical protein
MIFYYSLDLDMERENNLFYIGAKLGHLPLSEEHSLRVFENRMLRNLCGSGVEEVKGGSTKLYSKKILDWQPSQNIIRLRNPRCVGWVGYVAHNGNKCDPGYSRETLDDKGVD